MFSLKCVKANSPYECERIHPKEKMESKKDKSPKNSNKGCISLMNMGKSYSRMLYMLWIQWFFSFLNGTAAL
jgi:hypothetical protein